MFEQLHQKVTVKVLCWIPLSIKLVWGELTWNCVSDILGSKRLDIDIIFAECKLYLVVDIKQKIILIKTITKCNCLKKNVETLYNSYGSIGVAQS